VCVVQSKSKNEGLKEMHSLAISRFFLPGEAQFPLNAMYSKPANRQEEGRWFHRVRTVKITLRHITSELFVTQLRICVCRVLTATGLVSEKGPFSTPQSLERSTSLNRSPKICHK